MLQESGYIEKQESRTQLEDKEAVGYMDLEISGDEESEVKKDDNTDPEAGEAVGALEEGDVVWAQEEGEVVGVLANGDGVGELKEGCDQAA